jgi:hypothetical protein
MHKQVFVILSGFSEQMENWKVGIPNGDEGFLQLPLQNLRKEIT